MEETRTYLGFDFSTQQAKAIIVNENCKVIHEAFVQYDSELPEYRTHGGVHVHKDGQTVTSPAIMWVKALDMLLDKLRVTSADFSLVASISGAAQQHGSVYWRRGFQNQLKNLDSSKFLHDQLVLAFSISDSPVWMDSSTAAQCQKLEQTAGGSENLAKITGSRAFHRFTGNQIAKIFEQKRDAYLNTERISLVSSFVCSLFIGDYAPIDYADGCGMNLFNISEKRWSQDLLQACAPELEEKLGDLVPSRTNVGSISPYFVERYGFYSSCKVVAFTGDNPASLSGMCLRQGDVAISLGTSDTVFAWIDEPKPNTKAHVLINPVDENFYMTLLCFKNGSLAREKVRDACAEGSWDLFNELLDLTPRGNFGNIGMYYYSAEIIPNIEGIFCFNKENKPLAKFSSKEVEVRSLVEGQFLSRRVHAEDIGLKLGPETKVLATGGASCNKILLQVLADVFNAPVYTMDIPNSGCVGAAFRAKHGLIGENFHSCIESLPSRLECTPNSDAKQIYDVMAERFRMLEERICRNENC